MLFDIDVGETPKKSNIDFLDSLLKFVQIMAVLFSGLWVLYQFLSFQREANRLSFKQQELATQQSEFNLRTQQAAEKANLAQITLAAQQAEFTLQTQRSQKELRDQDLKYSVESKRLENESSRVALISKTTYRASRSSTLIARLLSNGLYEIILNPGIKNVGDTTFEVSLIIVDSYVGQINPELVSKPMVGIPRARMSQNLLRRVVTDPPGRWHQSVPGAVDWHLVATSASAYSMAYEDVLRWYSDGDPDTNQFGTGPWKPGEEVDFRPRLIVSAGPTDYVGFSVHIIVNRAKTEDDIWWFAEYEPLEVALKNESLPKNRGSSVTSDSSKP
jgi:hypothetical protein